jgi:adenosine deaminase
MTTIAPGPAPIPTAITAIPKAELHVHLEGTITPRRARFLAARNGIKLPEGLFTNDDRYAWGTFLEFLAAYDVGASVLKTAQDFRDITHDYLVHAAAQGAIYVEFFISADHFKASAGLDYADGVAALADAATDARATHGIECRFIATGVSHYGVEAVTNAAQLTVQHPHPLVTGFGLGGAEIDHPRSAYKRAFDIAAKEAGLACTAHAGEVGGPDSIRDALDHLPIIRIGHGVQAIFDADLVRRIVDEGIVLEVCPSSNVLIVDAFKTPRQHPFAKLAHAGCKVTLSTDDPPYFDATLNGEYRLVHDALSVPIEQLVEASRTAINAAFVDETTRVRLLGTLQAHAISMHSAETRSGNQ